LSKAVVIGATGGIEDPSQRAERRQADEATADALEASGDVDAFIDTWVASPMFSRLADAADATERRRNSASGLASSLRLAGTGTQEPLWERIRDIDVPLLTLAGSDDNRFGAHALRLAQTAAHGVASLVPGGGHAVHLAQPDAVVRVVHHWLSTV
jgi:pimeloyl-ACP methyl ester carboxylesterase